MYRKYRDSLFNIQYSHRGKKYCDVPVHRCIVAGLIHIQTIGPKQRNYNKMKGHFADSNLMLERIKYIYSNWLAHNVNLKQCQMEWPFKPRQKNACVLLTCRASDLVTSPLIINKARAWSDLKSGYLLAMPWSRLKHSMSEEAELNMTTMSHVWHQTLKAT